ncbi:MAG: alpha/beta hydrolase [Pseudomonadota bacterium]
MTRPVPTPDYRTLTWLGHRIAWWETRQHEPGVPSLLLLHGFPSSSRDWHHVASLLADRVRVVGFDFLGYGRSAKAKSADYSVFAQADLTAFVIDELCGGAAMVVGHDVGGIVLQDLLDRDLSLPHGRISQACFVNSSVYSALYKPTRAQKLLTIPVLGQMVAARMTRKAFVAGIASVSGTNTPQLRAQADEMMLEYSSNGGRRLSPRHLVYMKERRAHAARLEAAMAKTDPSRLAFVYGAADPVSGQQQIGEIKRRLPDARVTALNGLGHFPMLEDARAVARGIASTFKLGES